MTDRASTTYRQDRVARLVAARRCVRCRAGLLDHERYQACGECLEKQRKRKGTRKNLRRAAATQKARYWKDPAKFRARNKATREAKKLRGECRDCPEKCMSNSDFCRKHRDERAARKRDYYARVRKGKASKESP